MKTIELSTGTLLVVDGIFYERAGVDIPDGFDFLGHPSEITGEVWGKVCERFGIAGWKNYNFESQYEELLWQSPLLSGLSLCAAHNIQESDVLLFKPKNS